MNFINNIRIKKKLLISYLIIVLAPIIFIAYFLTQKLYSESFSSTVQLSDASIRQLSDNFLNKFTKYKEVVDSLFNNNKLRNYVDHNYDTSYDSYIDLKNNIIPMISEFESNNVYIKIYTNNQTIGYSGFTNNLISDLKHEPWYDPAILNSQLNWSRPFRLSVADDRNFIACYRKLIDYDKNNEKIVLSVFFDERELFSFINKEKYFGGKIIIFLQR